MLNTKKLCISRMNLSKSFNNQNHPIMQTHHLLITIMVFNDRFLVSLQISILQSLSDLTFLFEQPDGTHCSPYNGVNWFSIVLPQDDSPAHLPNRHR